MQPTSSKIAVLYTIGDDQYGTDRESLRVVKEWNSEKNEYTKPAYATGLKIPMRLGKLSKGYHLTIKKDVYWISLVMSQKGVEMQLNYQTSRFTHFPFALKNVAQYYDCPISELGYCDLTNQKVQTQMTELGEKVKSWAQQFKFDGAIWYEGQEDTKIAGRVVDYFKETQYQATLTNTKRYLDTTADPLSMESQEVLTLTLE